MSNFEPWSALLIDENETRYGDEIRSKYGDEAIDQTNAKIGSMPSEQYAEWKRLEQKIQAELEQAVRSQATADSEAGKHLTELHRRWLSFTWSSYSPDAHRGLAQMYVCDARFTDYYDRSVPGCTAFLRDAIQIHA